LFFFGLQIFDQDICFLCTSKCNVSSLEFLKSGIPTILLMTGFCHFLGNRQAHIRRDKSETQVLEFNDGNNELQQNRIEGSGSKILLGKSQEELEELAIALGEVSI
jgi:hypothetical protein